MQQVLHAQLAHDRPGTHLHDVQAQQTDEKEPSDAVKSKKTHRKHLLAEINAVKGLLRAQADAAGPSDGYAIYVGDKS